MAGNSYLISANKGKNDEWYTQLPDIEKELFHYKEFFKGKTVLCNCDDPYESNFFKYFAMNFNFLGLKKLIATCYTDSPVAGQQLSLFNLLGEQPPENNNHKPYKAIITTVYDKTGNGSVDLFDIVELFKSGENTITELSGDGDFRSPECVELLKEADIVVTNPPFSLFRSYIDQLMSYNKKFIVLSRMTSISLKDFFSYIMDNKVWSGYGFNLSMVYKTPYPNLLEDNRKFVISKGYNPDDGFVKVPGICWFTNLDIKKRHDKFEFYRDYDPDEYQKYDNYDAIHIPKVEDIPDNYTGVMGVPITFLEKHNPDQFEILGITDRNNPYGLTTKIYTKADAKNYSDLNRRAALILPDGSYKATFARLLIRRR